VIPTPRLLLFLLLGATLVAGVAFAPVLVWLALLYLVAVAVVVVVDYRATPRPDQIEAERIHDSKLSIGADNQITLLLTNRGARPFDLTLRDEFPDAFSASAQLLRGTLPGYELLELRYTVRPPRRGDYAFAQLNIRYQSALKTFVRQASYPIGTTVRVYPNVLEVRKYDLMARKGLLLELGLRPARIYGTGTEFERLREYTTDDEFRRINWKATARRGKPIAAEYETERSQFVMSVIDTGRLMRPPVGGLMKLDYAVNAALLLSYVAAGKGDHTGLLTFADDVRTYLPPRRGRGQFYRMLEALYAVQEEAVEPDHARALSYLSIKQKRRSLVVLFTDLTTLDAAQPLIANLSRLAQRHLPLCVVMSDPDVNRLAVQPTRDADAVYRRAVAEQLLDERRTVLETLHRSGVLTIDVPADKLSVAVISRYLELKARGAL
jgi:uncharacterized protein (DUF58 family)